ncbi:hypothetical protein H0H92_005610, partial [Tricholoma furcatifolium]
ILEEHDSKIARVEAELNQLLAERKSYTSRMDKLHSALSAHKMLPPELLTKIFVEASPSPLCLRSTADSGSLVIRDDGSRSLLPALSVCSRWRQIALDSRDLWDSVIVDYPSYVPNDTWVANAGVMTSMARTVISRGTRHIDIRMDAKRKINPLGHDLPHETPHFPIFITADEFLRSSPFPFPALRSVVFEGPTYSLPTFLPESRFKWPAFQNAPNLRSLKIYSFFSEMSNPFSQPELGLPFDQLTEVILDSSFLSLNATLALLSHSFATSIIAARFLDNLTLPCLHSFELTDNFIDENSIAALISLISRSNCVLQRFSAPLAAILTEYLDPLLKIIPRLTDLAIPKATVPIRMLEHISQGLLLPELTKLNCTILASPRSLEAFMEAVDRSGVGHSGYEAAQIAVATARYPAAERHYGRNGAPRWIQVNEKFKAFENRLQKEGRIVSVKG